MPEQTEMTLGGPAAAERGKRKPFPAEQVQLPGLMREPAMENHPPPAIVPAGQVGNWSTSRHDAIVTRFKLTDAIQLWNRSCDSAGEYAYKRVQESRYGRLTRQILDALDLSDEQRRVVRDQKLQYRDNVDACILMCFNLAEFLLANAILSAVESRLMTHGQIHGQFTKTLKALAPHLLSTIAIAKGTTK